MKKIILFKSAIWVSKDSEFDVDFESGEKVANRLKLKSYNRQSDTKIEFFYFYYCVQRFSAYNFFWMNLLIGTFC